MKTSIIKTLFYKSHEYYLIILVMLAAYSPPFHIHPFFIGLISLLLIQIIVQNKVVGLVLGCVFFFINLYFLAALLSEFAEFTTLNSSAMKLIGVGLPIFLFNLLMSATMVYKYLKLIEGNETQKTLAME